MWGYCNMSFKMISDTPFLKVTVNIGHQKHFKFEWLGKCNKFIGMSNGYSDAMRIYAKNY